MTIFFAKSNWLKQFVIFFSLSLFFKLSFVYLKIHRFISLRLPTKHSIVSWNLLVGIDVVTWIVLTVAVQGKSVILSPLELICMNIYAIANGSTGITKVGFFFGIPANFRDQIRTFLFFWYSRTCVRNMIWFSIPIARVDCGNGNQNQCNQCFWNWGHRHCEKQKQLA